MKIVKGDLIQLAKEGKFDLIAHGCNCFCTFGAGIAKSIKQHFPSAYVDDLGTEKGDSRKLGTCRAVFIYDFLHLTIVNAYTQYRYGKDKVHLDYDAVRSCMKWIAKEYSDKKIGLPKIGAGMAGGDWEKIQQIIEEELKDCDVTVVEYDK